MTNRIAILISGNGTNMEAIFDPAAAHGIGGAASRAGPGGQQSGAEL